MISGTSGVGSDVTTAVQTSKSTSVADENKLTSNDSSTSNVSLGKQDQNDGKELSEDDVSKMSDALNKFMEQSKDCNIRFDYCKELDRMTMQVVDKKTNEVIKEFPPKKMLDVLIGIREWVGVLLDKKV
ncbi:MAG: flagellar protein FlaG [Firmicutes bacterium]|nr:flagellar protein FlaG [Bacillota bacterium]